MNKSFACIIICFFVISAGYNGLEAQQQTSSPEATPEQQYAGFIARALRLQVMADSLNRTANQKRRELAFSGNETARESLREQILALEQESFRIQKDADSLYAQARALELRLVSGGYSTAGAVSGQADFRPGAVNPEFLVLGEYRINSGLSPTDLMKAAELEEDYKRAKSLLGEAAALDNELEYLNELLSENPRRRERRRLNQQADELFERSYARKMEAMIVYQEVHNLRYRAAANYLENKRREISDPLILRSGMEQEELAHEKFRQSRGLRETASGLRSDRYFEEYIMRAFDVELEAFDQLEKALEIYNTPAPRAVTSSMPMQADGRLDPATALTRVRNAEAEVPVTGRQPARSGQPVDFGFSILPQSPYSAGNPIPSEYSLPPGMVYSIQLGSYNSLMPHGSFGGLYPVMLERDQGNGSVRYVTGVFRSLQDAERALLDVNRQGFTDAFVVAYNDGLRMPVARARQIERSRATEQSDAPSAHAAPATPAASGTPAAAGAAASGTRAGSAATATGPTANQNEAGHAGPGNTTGHAGPPATRDISSGDSRASTPAVRDNYSPGSPPASIPGRTTNDGEQVFFMIQLGAFREIVSTPVYNKWQEVAGAKNVTMARNNNGLYVYSIGKFNTFEEVDRFRNHLRANGITEFFVVPYLGEQRITMERANQLLQGQ